MFDMKLRLSRRKRRIRWSFSTLVGIAALLVVISFAWQLGNLTPGLSASEINAASSSLSGTVIMSDPQYAPHKVVQYVSQKINDSPSSLRLASVMFGLVIVASFYFVAIRWFGRVISLLTTLLLASSPWLLIHAHQATPYILLAWPIVILAAFLWLRTTEKHAELAAIGLTAAIVVALYIPGMLWMLLLGTLLAVRPGWRSLKQYCSRSVYAVLGGVLVFAVVPLVLAIISRPDLLADFLLLPDNWPSLNEFSKAVGWALIGIVWRTRDPLDTTLGNLPVLDMLGIMLFTLGIIAATTQFKRWRSWWLGGSLLLAAIVVGLSNNALLLLLALPAIMLLIGVGMDFLHRQWFEVFPRNPIAKYAALSVMTIAVCLSVLYGWRYSLVAWPRAPETTSVYVVQ